MNKPDEDLVRQYLEKYVERVTIQDQQKIEPYFYTFDKERFNEYRKEELAISLGKFLLKNNLVNFTEEVLPNDTSRMRIELLILKPKKDESEN